MKSFLNDNALVLILFISMLALLGQVASLPHKAEVPIEENISSLLEPKIPNINKVTYEELSRMPKISKRLALEIVTQRQLKGGFKTIDELQDIKGVGDKIFAMLSASFLVE